MFQFSRPTLWIMLNVSMLMIILLNYFGSSSEQAQTESASPQAEMAVNGVTAWPLSQIQPDCSHLKCLLELPGAASVAVSFIAQQQPTGQPIVPFDLPLNTEHQGGYFVATSTLTENAELGPAIDFFEGWLPAEGEVKIVLSGAVEAPWVQAFVEHQFGFNGASKPLTAPVEASLGMLTSPRFGDEDQLAFLMWIEVLRSRLQGYNISARWDHRGAQSRVLFSGTLSADTFFPVTETELAPILNAYKTAASQTQRGGEQVHRYLQTAMVYTLPFRFFTDQLERLNRVTLVAVNNMREQSLEQITQP